MATIEPPKRTITTTTHSKSIVTKTDDTDYVAWLNVVLPVVLFFLGLWFSRILENRKEKKRLADLEQYFYSLIPYLNTALELQIKAIMKTARKVKEYKENNLVIAEVATLRTERFRGVNNSDLYQIFIANKNGNIEVNTKHFHEVTSSIDFIDSAKPLLENSSKGIVTFATDFARKWNANNAKLLDLQNNLVIRSREVQLDESAIVIVRAINETITSNRERMKVANSVQDGYNLLIRPVYEATRGVKANADTYALLSLLSEIVGEYNRLQQFKKNRISHLAKMARSLNHARIALLNSMAYFQSLSNK